MSESLLEALMQMFAIVAKLGGVVPHEREIVRKFLTQQVSSTKVDKYLALFDKYSQEKRAIRVEVADEYFNEERASVRDSSKMMLICQKANQELTQQQKVIVIIRLLELIISDDDISEQEHEFVKVAADAFNIDAGDFEIIEQFVVVKDITELDHEKIVLMSTLSGANLSKSKQVIKDRLDGVLAFFCVSNIRMILMRFEGEEALLLNGNPLKNNQVYPFPIGSTIRGSQIQTIFFSEVANHFRRRIDLPELSFEAINISYQFPNGDHAIRNVSIQESAGTMVGLMGGSGVGKSTLMEALNGMRKPSEGQVLINGLDVYDDESELRGVIGYVPQDDLLISQLTVYENLFFAAQLCFGSFSQEAIEQIVRDTLESLQLTEVIDLKVGTAVDRVLSGGQRKRLNIGLELLRAPSVMFVDEPTSGLSSRDSVNIMNLLKELTSKGKLIFVVIHQPSSDIFKMFDRLMVLDTGGYPVFYDHPTDSVGYFRNHMNHVAADEGQCPECGNINAHEIFDLLENRVVNEFGQHTSERRIDPQTWHGYFEKSLVKPNIKRVRSKPDQSQEIASIWRQWWVFVARDGLAKLANRQYILINLFQGPVLAFVLAYICKYYQGEVYVFSKNENLPVYLFMSVIVTLFMGLTISAQEILRDRKILKREKFLHLSRNSYLMSKVFILTIIAAFQTLLYTAVGNLVIEIHGLFWQHWLVLFISTGFAILLGLNISASFDSAVTIYVLIPILLIPQIILGGMVIPFDKINPNLNRKSGIPVIADIMVSRWAFEALAVTQFKDNSFEKEFYELDQALAEADYVKVYWVPLMQTQLANINESQAETTGVFRSELEMMVDSKPYLSHIDLSHVNWSSTKALEKELIDILDEIKREAINFYNTTNRQKDRVILNWDSAAHSGLSMVECRTTNYNELLGDLVKNNFTTDRIEWTDQGIVGKIYPIFLMPRTSSFKLSPRFYSPFKYIFGRPVGALMANLLVIVLMTIVLYVTLYFDLLRKFLRLLNGRLI